MRKSNSFVAATIAVAALWSGGAPAQSTQLVVELNKLESIENGCRTFFLFRNQTAMTFQAFEMSLAVFDQQGVIDRLLTVEASPLPAGRTTLKLFEIPDMQCDGVGEILLHEIAKCEPDRGEAVDCFAIIDLQSRAAATLVK
ncbi:MAG: hypothetical protein V3R98_15150 [Alphaproteobacteria bacterium]